VKAGYLVVLISWFETADKGRKDTKSERRKCGGNPLAKLSQKKKKN